MATTYPGTKQTFTNPVGTNFLDNPDHAGQHADINDTVEAVQDAVGTTLGTNVLSNFSAGQFPLRVTGGGATGTHVTTLVGGTLANTALIGTPQITGGSVTNAALIGTSQITGGTITNAALIGTSQITGGSVSSAVLANDTIGTPAITGGTWTNPAMIGTGQITGGSVTSAVVASPTITTPAISNGTYNNGLFGTPTVVLGSDAAGDLLYRSSGGTLTRLAAGTLNHVLTSGGIGTAPSWAVAAAGGLGTNAQGCKVYLSADGTLFNGTAYKIIFDTETYDTGAAWSTAANEYVVPAGKGGYYAMGVFAYLYGSLTVGNQFKSYVYVNGAEIHEDQFVCAANNTGETTKCITFHNVAAGGTIAFYAFSPQANTKIYANGGVATHTWAFVQQITND